MKRFVFNFVLFLICVFFLISITACKEEQKVQNELAVGNWVHVKNRTYILLILNPKGEWQSSIRIADASSKIVEAKGNAKGMWYIEKEQMIFTVTESDIEDVWEKNATIFFDIIELTETLIRLKDESGRIWVWGPTTSRKSGASEDDLTSVIPMGVVAVNLNKNRSNDKDRYLCLNLNLILKELMPGQKMPPIHPKAREAAIIFFSSLVFNDVKDFDRIKQQIVKLMDVLNPYLDGFVKEISIEHVLVATEIDKVEEFIIEHDLTNEPVSEAGEEGKEGSEGK
ncbi:flagellar basal body-associated FliL family protein [Desulfobacula toluolica]|uniref:Conserved uncharacterized protein n=1 Tax=Desulfobacula toluolica (strain DSM 7467 / Tol2) TaxID=651182 RepID=K0N5R9_DESTT|nr:flagellar basal body-associated FliL family protein [Desulfobacula toluolica]CCK79404.1 conserved uncharacterized protein [Desulfobacula toluolica Tol2]